jgi:hypothetical protein
LGTADTDRNRPRQFDPLRCAHSVGPDRKGVPSRAAVVGPRIEWSESAGFFQNSPDCRVDLTEAFHGVGKHVRELGPAHPGVLVTGLKRRQLNFYRIDLSLFHEAGVPRPAVVTPSSPIFANICTDPLDGLNILELGEVQRVSRPSLQPPLEQHERVDNALQ